MLLPTRLKVKISSKLSYPVGAELISSELGSVPQAPNLGISFHNKYEWVTTRGNPYRIFTVSYSGTRSTYSPGWAIEVRPVPRALKHTVKESLKCEFFPRIRQWLQKYADLDSRYGGHSLSVVMDERGETLLRLEEHHSPGEAFSN
jgi:hypothetical protein